MAARPADRPAAAPASTLEAKSVGGTSPWRDSEPDAKPDEVEQEASAPTHEAANIVGGEDAAKAIDDTVAGGEDAAGDGADEHRDDVTIAEVGASRNTPLPRPPSISLTVVSILHR